MRRRGGSDPDVVRLVYPCKLDFLPLLNAVAEEVLRVAGAGEDDALKIANALMEAATNASQCGGEGTEVEVEFRFGGGQFEVRVSDRGPGFDPDQALKETGEPIALRGRGIFIMKALMDEVRFEANPGGGTTVRMRKRFGDRER